jgi:hypothetical protein
MSGLSVHGFQKFRVDEVRDKFVKGAAQGREADMLRTAVRNSVLSAVNSILPATQRQVKDKMFFTQRNKMKLKPKQIGVNTGKGKERLKQIVYNSIKGTEKVTRNRVEFNYEYDADSVAGYLLRKNKKVMVHSSKLYYWVKTKLGIENDKKAKSVAFAIVKSWANHGRMKIADKDAFNVIKNPYANEIFTKRLEKNMAAVVEKFKDRYLNAIKKQYK